MFLDEINFMIINIKIGNNSCSWNMNLFQGSSFSPHHDYSQFLHRIFAWNVKNHKRTFNFPYFFHEWNISYRRWTLPRGSKYLFYERSWKKLFTFILQTRQCRIRWWNRFCIHLWRCTENRICNTTVITFIPI